MKILVIYESFFGNTEQIAREVAAALVEAGEVETIKVSEMTIARLAEANMVIAGSPTRGFRPSEGMAAFLKSIPPDGLRGIKAAAFDTGLKLEDITSGFLRFMARIFGYAAKPIGDALQKKGAVLVVPPEGFFVNGSEGPLKEGELARAAEWGKTIRGLI